MADNLRKYTTQEVLNKVYTDSSGITIGLNSQSSKETLNAVLDSSNNRLQVAMAGGTISGDLTITGDLKVEGGGSLAFDEIVEGTQVIEVTNTEAFLVRKASDGGDVFVVDTTNSKVLIANSKMIVDANSRISLSNNTSFDSGTSNTVFGKSIGDIDACLLYTSPSPRDLSTDRMASSA